jgi:2,4-dienoyl-CoA reductase-like NADH-dependent reductase (Old Yellow Enzyme family)
MNAVERLHKHITLAELSMPTLFDPITLGALNLKNRILMAPLTRCRADEGRVPNKLMAEYYAQRSSAGLILSEATSVTPMGVGYPDTPGIWSDEQVQGWKLVTDAVHQAGGQMFLQLWHVGRISDPIYLEGKTPVAPSAVQPAGHVSHVRPKKGFEKPRALTLNEIKEVIQSYRQGAFNAKAAGFDGVHIHAANGYLLDQFLQDKTNLRDDEYGGSLENRARLLLEVTDVCIDVWGKGRVAVHLAPRMDASDMGDSNPIRTFGYVATELGKRNIAFISTREYEAEDGLTPALKELFGGPVVANERFDKTQGNDWLATGKADAIAFGVPFLANPDLPRRMQLDAELNPPRPELFFVQGAEGYTDYPTLAFSSSEL